MQLANRTSSEYTLSSKEEKALTVSPASSKLASDEPPLDEGTTLPVSPASTEFASVESPINEVTPQYPTIILLTSPSATASDAAHMRNHLPTRLRGDHNRIATTKESVRCSAEEAQAPKIEKSDAFYGVMSQQKVSKKTAVDCDFHLRETIEHINFLASLEKEVDDLCREMLATTGKERGWLIEKHRFVSLILVEEKKKFMTRIQWLQSQLA